MPAKQRRRELTDFQKGQIEGRRQYISHANIGHELGIPRTTVTSFLERLDKLDSDENLPHPGRPRKTSHTTDRHIVHMAESETRVPLAEILAKTDCNVSEQTIRRRLREAGIRKGKTMSRPRLTKKHAAKQLKWAKEHRQWTREDWAKVGWSDECAVEKDSDTVVQWVFRRRNAREKYAPKNIRGKSRDGRISQMVWGCFVGDKLGPIAFIDGMVNTDVYIAVLNDNLLSFIDALNADGFSDIIFQQDNASSHMSKKTKECLANSVREHGFVIMEWPANSPDMNPIENLWAHLKLELHRRWPDTATIRGSPATIKAVLKRRLMEIWWDIGDGVLKDLIDSMPHRVRALLDARGWYTKY